MGPYNKVHTDFIEIYFDFCFVLFVFFFFIDPWPHCEGAGRRWEWGFGGFS